LAKLKEIKGKKHDLKDRIIQRCRRFQQNRTRYNRRELRQKEKICCGQNRTIQGRLNKICVKSDKTRENRKEESM
jgi:hypothetical protein